MEKAELDDVVLQTLEKDGLPVVRGDWRRHIDPEVAQDLRKYRSYKGVSVRDLLRALRNKVIFSFNMLFGSQSMHWIFFFG